MTHYRGSRRIGAALALIVVVAACGGNSTAGPHVDAAWSRDTAERQGTGVVYLSVVNDTDRAVTLTGARVSGAVAARAELHHGAIDADGMATMREVRSLRVGPHRTLNLRPGGDHVMLVGLRTPLRVGDSFRISLTRGTRPPLVATVRVRRS